MSRLRIAILGATGSIGSQALDVIDRYPDRFEVFGLLAGSRPLDRDARFAIRAADVDAAARTEEMVTHPDCDVVVTAIPGARALAPTLAALRAGKVVALATKEVLVMAGELVMTEAHQRLRPVDSEHSAVWQCLWGEHIDSVSRLVLTASGGPFYARPEVDLERATVAEALNHPRWTMGPKVTVDSATLMNKGLELIEAHHLFGVALDRIDVVIHPQSIVHSMVEFIDGSSKAQLGQPDMRLPIAVALAYPDRLRGVVEPLSVPTLGSLDFAPLDPVRFPAPGLARRAAASGAPYPAVLNAVNEEAVGAFLRGEIRFPGILRAVESALEHYRGSGSSLEEIMEADRWARDYFKEIAGKVSP
ncbi:MAG TPA: 1-deoxy-D-xylulose-5-phosphate reductoisomerase [Candidatus Dormibacteraeota bacterium]|nr:1-deoxy-D-xylulose-5-phosphate reductoisomerase [Candidatus Dormibacteraeota bacterium]